MSINKSNYQAEGILLSGLRSWRVVFQEDVETGVTCKANVPGDDVVGPIRVYIFVKQFCTPCSATKLHYWDIVQLK